jgi:hypothetical protein
LRGQNYEKNGLGNFFLKKNFFLFFLQNIKKDAYLCGVDLDEFCFVFYEVKVFEAVVGFKSRIVHADRDASGASVSALLTGNSLPVFYIL